MLESKGKIKSSSSPTLKALLFVIVTYTILICSIFLVVVIGGGIIYFIIEGIINAQTERVAVPIGFMITIVIGTVYSISAILKGLRASFDFGRRESFYIGININVDEHPRLKTFIYDLCKTVGTKIPKNVFLHAESTFFVRQGKAKVYNLKISGRTLAIGLPLLSYLNINELRAIMVHEFAHFTGKDTIYTTIIYPAYLSAEMVILNMQDYIEECSITKGGWKYTIPLLIPNALLKLYLKNFNLSDMKLSRRQEHRADILAESICGGKSYKTALLKAYGISDVFYEYSKNDIKNAYKEGKVYTNYYNYFENSSDTIIDLANKYLNSEMNKTTEKLDSHPSLADRLNYITTDNEVFDNHKPALSLLENPEELQKEMTKLYTQYLAYKNGW